MSVVQRLRTSLPVICCFIALAAAAGCAQVDDGPGSDAPVETILPDGEVFVEEFQREQCNNRDDDGNGKADDGVGEHGELIESCSTECGDGWRSCFGGEWWPCSAQKPYSDGTCPCTEGQEKRCETRCGVGVQVCTDGRYGSCSAGTGNEEVCDNNIDDDCDGEIDEGDCGCENGATKPCGNETGECAAGSQRCMLGEWGECLGLVGPKPETCNGKDDDCDGTNDNNIDGDRYEENNSCEWGARLPNAPEGGSDNSAEGSLHTPADQDWFMIRGEEASHWCVPFTDQCCFTLTVRIDVEEGEPPQVCIYKDGCSGSPSCTSPGQTTATSRFTGTCSLPDDKDFAVKVSNHAGKTNCHTYDIVYNFDYSG